MGKIVKGAWMKLETPAKARRKTKPVPAPIAPIYQLKIVLKGSKPPIWRRLQIRGSTTLTKLHRALQIVMGWEDCHLHTFEINGDFYAEADIDMDDTEDESAMSLGELVQKPKEKFLYEYDLGDGWAHTITVEKILPPDAERKLPACVAGFGACPPEDCGGMWGYYSILDAIADPKNPEHEELLEWVPKDFDPEAFDLESVNKGVEEDSG